MAMPPETAQAVKWAIEQMGRVPDGPFDRHELVELTRQYFMEHGIECRPMSAADLDPYLPPSE